MHGSNDGFRLSTRPPRLPVATVSDLAAHLDRTPGTITHHLQQLAADGVVSRERDGRAVRNRLTGSARRQLAELSDSMAVGPAEEASD